jgi:hypothetical protein
LVASAGFKGKFLMMRWQSPDRVAVFQPDICHQWQRIGLTEDRQEKCARKSQSPAAG